MSTKVGEKNHHDKPIEFPAKLEHLYEMLSYIKEMATHIGFSKTLVSKIELAGEEALVNIISHGYPQTLGTIRIHCQKTEKGSLLITVKDDGIAFNPVEAIKNFSPADMDESDDSVDDTQIGGYGIYFIVNMMDVVDYQRVDNSNVLMLTKHL
jgi:serine/threonine-protein kinase RsbW